MKYLLKLKETDINYSWLTGNCDIYAIYGS